MTPQEILAKRISVFPSDENMEDADIKRNVYAAMQEYAQQIASLAYDEGVGNQWHKGTVEYKVRKVNAINVLFNNPKPDTNEAINL